MKKKKIKESQIVLIISPTLSTIAAVFFIVSMDQEQNNFNIISAKITWILALVQWIVFFVQMIKMVRRKQ